MSLKITPNLFIEDEDHEVNEIINRIRKDNPQPLPLYLEKGNHDWFLVSINLTRENEPVEGTLYLIQHFGKIGDTGYMAYVLHEVFKNRKELDLIVKLLEHHKASLESQGQKSDFFKGCSEMVRGLRLGASLLELSRKGILHTPPPNLN